MKPSIHQIALCSPKGNLNFVEQAFALVVARSGLEIGSNLNWTELNTVFRLKVQASLEPALPIWSTFTAESRSDTEPENPTMSDFSMMFGDFLTYRGFR
jgi:hypothetical protein